MQRDIDHLLQIARCSDFTTRFALRAVSGHCRSLVDQKLITLDALNFLLTETIYDDPDRDWQGPCSSAYYTRCRLNPDNVVEMWRRSMLYGTALPDNVVERWRRSIPHDVLRLTSSRLSHILAFKGPVLTQADPLDPGQPQRVWCEIEAMTVLASLQEVAQVWRTWVQDWIHAVYVWHDHTEEEERRRCRERSQQFLRAMGNAQCLMQVLVSRHKIAFTYLHVKLKGTFVKDGEYIAEHRRIFFEPPGHGGEILPTGHWLL